MIQLEIPKKFPFNVAHNVKVCVRFSCSHSPLFVSVKLPKTKLTLSSTGGSHKSVRELF